MPLENFVVNSALIWDETNFLISITKWKDGEPTTWWWLIFNLEMKVICAIFFLNKFYKIFLSKLYFHKYVIVSPK